MNQRPLLEHLVLAIQYCSRRVAPNPPPTQQKYSGERLVQLAHVMRHTLHIKIQKIFAKRTLAVNCLKCLFYFGNIYRPLLTAPPPAVSHHLRLTRTAQKNFWTPLKHRQADEKKDAPLICLSSFWGSRADSTNLISYASFSPSLTSFSHLRRLSLSLTLSLFSFGIRNHVWHQRHHCTFIPYSQKSRLQKPLATLRVWGNDKPHKQQS